MVVWYDDKLWEMEYYGIASRLKLDVMRSTAKRCNTYNHCDSMPINKKCKVENPLPAFHDVSIKSTSCRLKVISSFVTVMASARFIHTNVYRTFKTNTRKQTNVCSMYLMCVQNKIIHVVREKKYPSSLWQITTPHHIIRNFSD